jgi:hypothetical protein
VMIAVLGLALGELETSVAVILTYYGVLFLLGLPFLRLGPRTLLALAAVWVVLAPVLSMLVRPHLPERQYASPAFDQLAHPGRLLSELMFTGYYPAVPWLVYLLLGLALGRCDLRSRRVQLGLVLGGLAATFLATAVSGAVSSRPDEHTSGTTPTDDWSWLLVDLPHSGTPFDLLTTAGSAALVIGLCLLLVPTSGAPRRVVQVVFGAGAMTLTLYSLHVVMRTERIPPAEEAASYPWHLVVLLGIGAVFALLRWRGPLEYGVRRAQSLVARQPA